MYFFFHYYHWIIFTTCLRHKFLLNNKLNLIMIFFFKGHHWQLGRLDDKQCINMNRTFTVKLLFNIRKRTEQKYWWGIFLCFIYFLGTTVLHNFSLSENAAFLCISILAKELIVVTMVVQIRDCRKYARKPGDKLLSINWFYIKYKFYFVQCLF